MSRVRPAHLVEPSLRGNRGSNVEQPEHHPTPLPDERQHPENAQTTRYVAGRGTDRRHPAVQRLWSPLEPGVDGGQDPEAHHCSRCQEHRRPSERDRLHIQLASRIAGTSRFS